MNNLRKSALMRWKVKLDQELSEVPKDKNSLLKKATLCGFLAGDGSVQIRKAKSFSRYQLDFYPDDKEMLQTYMNLVSQLYKKVPTLSFKYNVHIARLSNRFVVLDLMRDAKFGLKKWNLPMSLFKIKGAKENWLRAFFSAEGYVNKKVIKTQSVNVKSIKKVSKLLSELGIDNNYYEYQPKNAKHSRVGMIFINSFKSRMLYYKRIGFWHSRKQRLLKEALCL